MASPYIPLVLEAVERIEAELKRIHVSVRDLAGWPARSADHSSRPEVADIRAALRRSFEVTRQMRESVFAPDAMPPTETVRAHALRSLGIVIALQASSLERAAMPIVNAPRSRFEHVEAFRLHVLAEVGRINATWIVASKNLGPGDSMSRVLSDAEDGYAALGRDPDVAAFLGWGMSHDVEQFRRSCRVLAALLGLGVEPEETTAIEVPSLPSLLAHIASK